MKENIEMMNMNTLGAKINRVDEIQTNKRIKKEYRDEIRKLREENKQLIQENTKMKIVDLRFSSMGREKIMLSSMI